MNGGKLISQSGRILKQLNSSWQFKKLNSNFLCKKKKLNGKPDFHCHIINYRNN